MSKKRKSLSKRKSKRNFTRHAGHHPRNAIPMGVNFTPRGGMRS